MLQLRCFPVSWNSEIIMIPEPEKDVEKVISYKERPASSIRLNLEKVLQVRISLNLTKTTSHIRSSIWFPQNTRLSNKSTEFFLRN